MLVTFNFFISFKDHRLKKLLDIKTSISSLLAELNQTPSSRFLIKVMNEREEFLSLSLHTLDTLKETQRDLSQKVKFFLLQRVLIKGEVAVKTAKQVLRLDCPSGLAMVYD